MNHNQPVQTPSLPQARAVSYELKGTFLEVCDCRTICPCWTGGAPDEDACTGAFAWTVEAGAIDGIDVANLNVVSISTHAGHRDLAKQRVVLFVSEGANDAQVQALAGVFSGSYGGPLGELASLLGELLGIVRVPITVTKQRHAARLTVGKYISAHTSSLIGPSGRPTTLANAKLSTVLGTPAEVGVSQTFRIALAEHGMDLDLKDRSAMAGRFEYRHVPSPA